MTQEAADSQVDVQHLCRLAGLAQANGFDTKKWLVKTERCVVV